jgi:signal transduction histidine kinase
LRVAATDLVAEAARTLGFEPSITVEGPLDRLVDDVLAEHLLSVQREALANIARHAGASSADVSISMQDGWVVLMVEDDGVGPGDVRSGGHGVRNMGDRAAKLGGRFDLCEGERGGTTVVWSVPVRS